MCGGAAILRVIGLVFLVLAILAVTLGFVAPFWIRIPTAEPLFPARSGETTTRWPPVSGQAADDDEERYDDAGVRAAGPVTQGTGTTTERQTTTAAVVTSTTESSAAQDIVNSISNLLPSGTYWGLWAQCHNNLTCSYFWQDEFKMEREFEGN